MSLGFYADISKYKSGDALSATYMYEEEGVLPLVDQSFVPLNAWCELCLGEI
jgi:hypothetical protein